MGRGGLVEREEKGGNLGRGTVAALTRRRTLENDRGD